VAVQLTGANCNDSQQALALVDAIPALQGDRGRPRNRTDCVLGDRGYDAEAIRRVSVPAASYLGSPSATQNMAADWADGAGSSSGRSHGSISFADCASVVRSEPTSMKPS
jgi:hypothetical protein